MTNIKLIKDFGNDEADRAETDKEVNELFNGPFRRIVEVRLRNNAVLSRHKAVEPITVFCLSGAGVFTAGSDLEDSQNMRPGTLITLEGGVEHQVTADGELHLIVTKFKDS
jgi:quercetin dioxygenase-like cupin family protein